MHKFMTSVYRFQEKSRLDASAGGTVHTSKRPNPGKPGFHLLL